MLTAEQINRLLTILSESDNLESFHWMARDNGIIDFFIDCSDSEEVKSDEDLDLLEASLKDADIFGDYLYAARKRGMRPQGAIYANFSAEEAELFNAVGPYREPGFGNPYDNVAGKENGYAKFKENYTSFNRNS